MKETDPCELSPEDRKYRGESGLSKGTGVEKCRV